MSALAYPYESLLVSADKTPTPTPREFLHDMVASWDRRATSLPYQERIIEAVLEPSTYQVTCLMAAQTGKTTTLAAATLFYAQYRASDVLLAVPRENDKAVFRSQKLNPFIRRAHGWGHEVLAPRRGHVVNNEQLDTPFDTTIWFAHSGSPPSLQAKTVHVTVADEVDRFQLVGHDGHPVDLMRDRASTYEDSGLALHLLSSTPSQVATSRTVEEFNRSSREFWHPACLHETGDRLFRFDFYEHYQTGILYCDCNRVMSESDRRDALMAGDFIAENPAEVRERGFRLSRLDSLLVSAKSTFVEFGKRSRASFDAQVLALPSSEATRDDDFDADSIRDSRLDVHPWPDKVDSRTMGMDVQKRFVEIIILDFHAPEFHIVDHARIFRMESETHKELIARALDTMWDKWNPDLAFVDLGYEDVEVASGIHSSISGRRFWDREEGDRHFTYRRAAGVRGDAKTERIVSGKYAVGKFQCDAWRVGSSLCKTALSHLYREGRVTAERARLPVDYVDQMTSEVFRPESNDAPWQKRTSSSTNDLLDALVYAYAAAWFWQDKGSPRAVSRRHSKYLFARKLESE